MRYEIFKNAKTVILLYKIKPGELNLDRFLRKNYNKSLKTACLYLISKAKIYQDLSKNIIILFPNKQDDKLAALITYGAGQITGSPLLKYAFFRE